MKILIIDENATTQARYAEKLNSLPQSDVETLDMHVMLVDKSSYKEHLNIVDVIILGSALEEKSIFIARQIKEEFPEKSIIIFANDQNYNGHLIKQAQYVGVKRVMPDSSKEIEFLQELYSIDAEYRREGILTYGKITVITSPKGGAGSTTLTAGLGELSSEKDKKTLMIDLDLSTQDLTRALMLYGMQKDHFADWMDNLEKLSLRSFLDSLITVDDHTALLSAPSDHIIGYDLFYHQEGVSVIKKILELAKYEYENIIIDLAQPNNPMSEMIFKMADEIMVLTGECALSVTACELFLEKVKEINNDTDNVKIICTGGRHSVNEIKESINTNLELSDESWSFPNLPDDERAFDWPGSGKTLYSLSTNNTRKVIEFYAEELGVIDPQEEDSYAPVSKSKVINFPFLTQRKAITYKDNKEKPKKKASSKSN